MTASMEGRHWAAVALFLGGLAAMLSSLHSWSEAATPAFTGGLLAQGAGALVALLSDKPGTTAAAEAAAIERPDPILPDHVLIHEARSSFGGARGYRLVPRAEAELLLRQRDAEEDLLLGLTQRVPPGTVDRTD